MGPSEVLKVDTFGGLPGWLIMLIFLVMMAGASEIGYVWGARSTVEEKTQYIFPTVFAAVLAVLGLLLGFTVSMAVTRCDTRRILLLEEANALGTDYLRTQLLPEPERTELQNLIRRYVDIRMSYSEGGIDAERLRKARAETEEIQEQMWALAVAFAQKDPRSVTGGLVLESLNNTFDLDTSRWTAFLTHVPESVIYVNAFIGLLASLMLGYGFGLSRHRHRFSVALLTISVCAVLGVIIDMDRPRSGVIHVSQWPMIELQRQLAEPRR